MALGASNKVIPDRRKGAASRNTVVSFVRAMKLKQEKRRRFFTTVF